MTSTIVQIGNSLGTRIPRSELAKLGLKKGDQIELKIKKPTVTNYSEENKKAAAALNAIAKMGTMTQQRIDEWQAELQQQEQIAEQRLSDSIRR